MPKTPCLRFEQNNYETRIWYSVFAKQAFSTFSSEPSVPLYEVIQNELGKLKNSHHYVISGKNRKDLEVVFCLPMYQKSEFQLSISHNFGILSDTKLMLLIANYELFTKIRT